MLHYLVIRYSTETADDIGPVLVATENFCEFFPAGQGHLRALDVVTYVTVWRVPFCVKPAFALTLFYENYVKRRQLIATAA